MNRFGASEYSRTIRSIPDLTQKLFPRKNQALDGHDPGGTTSAASRQHSDAQG
jgi:hypothetical protein